MMPMNLLASLLAVADVVPGNALVRRLNDEVSVLPESAPETNENNWLSDDDLLDEVVARFTPDVVMAAFGADLAEAAVNERSLFLLGQAELARKAQHNFIEHLIMSDDLLQAELGREDV